jgi:hypothetical protein
MAKNSPFGVSFHASALIPVTRFGLLPKILLILQILPKQMRHIRQMVKSPAAALFAVRVVLWCAEPFPIHSV